MNAGKIDTILKTIAAQLADLFRNRLDFRWYPETFVCIALALLIYPAGRFLPVEFGYENELVENLQLIALFAAMIRCITTKHNRPLFRLISLLLFVMMLRETNFGKTLFYPDPVNPNEFLRWDEIPYAPYVDPVMIVYGIFAAIYFVRHRIYMFFPVFLQKGVIPVIPVITIAVSMTASIIIDKTVENCVAEETAELVFYVAFVAALWRAADPACRWIPDMKAAPAAAAGDAR